MTTNMYLLQTFIQERNLLKINESFRHKNYFLDILIQR